MENKYKTLGKNTFLVLIGGAGSKLIGFAMLPLYTRWLSVSDYGIIDLITVYSTLLIGLIACCVYDAVFVLPKGVSDDKKKGYFTSALLFLVLSSIVTAIVFYAISLCSKQFKVDGVFFSHLWMIYLFIISEMFFRTSQQFCRSIDKMILFSFSGMLVTLFTAILSFLFIPRWSIYGYVYAYVLSHLLGALFAFLLSKSYNYISLNNVKFLRIKEMLTYSIPLIPNAIMWWVVDAFNRPLMEKYVGLAGIGMYAVANKFPGLLSIINISFNTSWQISVLDEFGKEDYKVFYNRIFRIVFILLSFVFVIVTVVSKWLVAFLTSPDYFGAWVYIPLLTFGVLFSNVGGLVGSNFSASRESKYYFYSSFWAALCAAIMNYLLIPILELWGAAIASLSSFFVMAVSRILYSWKYVHITNLSLYVLIIVLDAILMLVVVKSANPIITISFLVIITYVHYLCIKPIIASIPLPWGHKFYT